MEVKQMKFFVDTANVADIKKANDLGVICGVTTNPSLLQKREEHISLMKGLWRIKRKKKQSQIKR